MSKSMSKSMKKKNSNTMFNKLVNNKITLYVVALIAFILLVGHIINSQFTAILLFFLAGGVAYCFTKNMTIVLGSSIAVTTIATMSRSFFVYQEGMKEGISGEKKSELSEESETTSTETNGTGTNGKGSNGTGSNGTGTNGTGTNGTGSTGTGSNGTGSTGTGTNGTGTNGTGTNGTGSNGTGSNGTGTNGTGTNGEAPEALTQLTPALFNNIPNKDQMQKQLGKATEMEQAYDNLEKIMGKDNIQSISTDTKDLIRQQNELIKQLKTMTPALNDAMSSIGNLDFSKLTGMFNSATKTLSEMKSQ
jgi:hypothetical protein